MKITPIIQNRIDSNQNTQRNFSQDKFSPANNSKPSFKQQTGQNVKNRLLYFLNCFLNIEGNEQNLTKLKGGLSQLKEQERNVLLLKHIEYLSMSRIANILNIKTASAKQISAIAKNKLKSAIFCDSQINPWKFIPNYGRKEYSNSQLMKAIIYKLETNCSWHNLPQEHPPGKIVNYHYNKWIQNETLRERINTKLIELGETVQLQNPNKITLPQTLLHKNEWDEICQFAEKKYNQQKPLSAQIKEKLNTIINDENCKLTEKEKMVLSNKLGITAECKGTEELANELKVTGTRIRFINRAGLKKFKNLQRLSR